MNKCITNRNAGFTLIELVIVVGIIAILSSLATIAMNKQIEKAKLVKLSAMMRYLSQDVAGINADFGLTKRYTATAKVGGKYNSSFLNAALLEMWEKYSTTNTYGHKNPVSNKMSVLNSTSITTAFKNPAIFISYNNTAFPYNTVAKNVNASGTVIVHINRNSMQVDVYYMDFKGVKSPNVLSVY